MDQKPYNMATHGLFYNIHNIYRPLFYNALSAPSPKGIHCNGVGGGGVLSLGIGINYVETVEGL